MSESEAGQIGIAEIGNTIPQPPRLRGDPVSDLQAMNAWVGDLHRTLAREANVVGTQRSILVVVNLLLRRVATLEAAVSELLPVAAKVKVESEQFDDLPYMPGTVSGTYVGAELAAAYDKINQIIAILRNP